MQSIIINQINSDCIYNNFSDDNIMFMYVTSIYFISFEHLQQLED